MRPNTTSQTVHGSSYCNMAAAGGLSATQVTIVQRVKVNPHLVARTKGCIHAQEHAHGTETKGATS